MDASGRNADGLQAVNGFLHQLGLSPISIESLFSDSDWTALIKMHAYVESSLNFLITRALGKPELGDIVARLDVSDRKKGKMAFVIALELLPSKHRSFIHKFSEIRNILVHDAKNLDFDLKTYIDSLDANKRRELKSSITPVIVSFVKGYTEEDADELFNETPQMAMMFCSVAVISLVYGQELLKQYLTQIAYERAKSIPKAPEPPHQSEGLHPEP